MAASGYTPISLYYSTTASAVPTAGNLANGELALNIADMKLYAKNSAGTVTLLASNASTTGVDSLSFGSTGLTPSTATTGAITVAGTLNVANGGTGVTTSTGTGSVVLSNSPTLVTPALGTPSSGTVTNLTGTASININGTVGATTPTTGAFTTLTTSSTVTLNGGTANGVTYLNGSKVLTSGSALTFDGTNLALTTTNAIYKVPTAGGSLFDAGGNNGIYILGSSNYVATYVAGSEQMRLTSTGLGIGTSSPSAKLHVYKSNQNQLQLQCDDTGQVNINMGGTTTPAKGAIYFSDNSGSMWFNTASTQRMTLDSSGNLGIGTSSPSTYGVPDAQNLVIGQGGANTGITLSAFNTGSSSISFSDQVSPSSARGYMAYNHNGDYLAFAANGSERMRIDASGNLGLGVTPSAWSNGKAIEVGVLGSALWGYAANETYMLSNAYFNGGWKYAAAASTTATRYSQISGQHIWSYAAAGTAGNPISFTQAMTLDASGYLMVGTTTSPSQQAVIYRTSATTSNGALLLDGNGNYAGLQFASSGTLYGSLAVDSSALYLTHNSVLTFRTGASTNVGGTERARIDSSGTFILKSGTTDNQLQFWNTAGSAEVARIGTSSGSLDFLVGSTVNISARIDSSGNMGVGTTTTTAARLTLASTTLPALTLPNIAEIATVSATAATGTINYDLTTQSVLYYTTNASANFTMNIRGNSGLSLNSMMSTGQSVTMAFLCTNGATAYYQTAMTIDGTSVTPKWQGGTAPTTGNASAIDSYVYTIIKTASATFTVLASQTKFA